MNISRTLVVMSAVGVLTGCALSPAPSPEDNPYYTTSPLDPLKPGTTGKGGVTTTPISNSRSIEVRPLPQTVIVPGKTLPAAPVALQPGAGVDVTSLARLDLNGDGTVTTQELLSDGLGRLMAYDRNDDGYLSPAEFQEAMGDRRNRYGGSTNLFKHLDINRDNQLSSQEVAKYLAPSIAALDRNKDGIIRELSPIPKFPEPVSIPANSTVPEGLPRVMAPGYAGTPSVSAYRAAAPAKKKRTHLTKPSNRVTSPARANRTAGKATQGVKGKKASISASAPKPAAAAAKRSKKPSKRG